ncbi:MAG: hypothetical protein ACYDC1_24430, partial [Limisphaerales bacterium]
MKPLLQHLYLLPNVFGVQPPLVGNLCGDHLIVALKFVVLEFRFRRDNQSKSKSVYEKACIRDRMTFATSVNRWYGSTYHLSYRSN